MGEVLLAYDERLRRRVAIKHVRADRTQTAGRRERFRREARAVARLNHPAIVQVFDILEGDDGDRIVMEYVEGESLADLLDRSPLDAPRAIRLGRELAEGLAEAHAHGLVHRDLKADNVMVTRSGHVKILDFGLAKSVWPEGDPSLSADGTVVGTSRAMSPEQASGRPVDHRSDLFSLGSLLYEAVTGVSPFDAENPLATMQRIIGERQPPARTLAAVPAELSDLIDHLLEKDPGDRPQEAREVARRLAALEGRLPAAAAPSPGVPGGPTTPPAGGGPWIAGSGRAPGGASSREVTAATAPAGAASPTVRSSRRRLARAALGAPVLLALATGLVQGLRWIEAAARPTRVAVAAPEVGALAGPASDPALLASELEVALLRGLLALEGVHPIDPSQLAGVTGSAEQVAKATGADEVLRSEVAAAGGELRVTLRRVRGDDGTVAWTGQFRAAPDEPRLLADAVLAHLRRAYPRAAVRPELAALDVADGDYAAFLRLRRLVEAPPAGVDWEAVLAELERIRAGSPRFLETYLLEARLARYLYATTRRDAHLRRAYALVELARRLAPADPRPLLREIDVALTAGDLERAEAGIEELARLTPGEVEVLEQRAELASRRGEGGKALALIERAAARRPSVHLFFQLADLSLRHGRVADARRHLEAGLRLSPENPYLQAKLAQLELTQGSVERAAELYGALVERHPLPSHLSNLGLAHLFLGDYGRAGESFRRALETSPRHPQITLNLADSLLLAGRPSEARASYRKALAILAEDPAPTRWQEQLIRAQCLAHLGRRHEAVAAAQRALELAPEVAEARYEAALVYALTGDLSLARVNAETAREMGISPRWFELPWFDPLARELRRAPEGSVPAPKASPR